MDFVKMTAYIRNLCQAKLLALQDLQRSAFHSSTRSNHIAEICVRSGMHYHVSEKVTGTTTSRTCVRPYEGLFGRILDRP